MSHPSSAILAVPVALFPDNRFMQSIVRNILKIHLRFYNALQVHFNEAVQNLYQNMAKNPTLVFVSKADLIGTEAFSSDLVKAWRSNGVDVTFKVFDDTAHVKHYQKYPKVYLQYLHEHWNRVKLLEK